MSSEQSVTEAPEQQAPRVAGEDHQGASGGYELDEDGQRIPHGMGQSKSSRRRRRKRKNKGSGDANAAPGAVASSGESSPDGQAIGAIQAGAPERASHQAALSPVTPPPTTTTCAPFAAMLSPRRRTG